MKIRDFDPRLAVLLAAAVAFLAALTAARPHREVVAGISPSVGASPDVDMYAAIVRRVRAGESYHPVVGSELRARGYPTIPVFNWRTPLLYSAMARVPPAAARGLLLALAAGLLAWTAVLLASRPAPVLIAGLVLQLGAAVAVAVPDAPFMSEGWAGILIGLSACAYARERHRAGALLGVAALFVRELAAPYLVLRAVLAVAKRRRHEAVVLLGGAVLYAGYFGWHAAQVSALVGPGDVAHRDSWFYAGGLSFLTSTLRMNAFALVAPAWCAAVLLAAIAAGGVSRDTPVGIRWSALLYVTLFLLIGQPFNYYWGLVTAPLWALAAAFGLEALGRAARGVAPARSAG